MYEPNPPVIINQSPIPQSTWKFDMTKFNYTEGWSPFPYKEVTLTNPSPSELVVTQANASTYNANAFWLYCVSCVPNLSSTFTYNISFEMKQNETNYLYPNNTVSIELVLIANPIYFPLTVYIPSWFFNDTV